VRSRLAVVRAAVLLAAVISAAGCGASDDAPDAVTVFAASSLTEAFTEIGDEFSSAHSGVTVTFNFAASSTLAGQIANGAPADVFASADEIQMQNVVNAGRVSGVAETFATNTLAIVVAAANPESIGDVSDLSRDGLVVVLAAPEVPIGAYTADVLAQAGVVARPASFEENVKAVVNKVALGEADAGIAYATDVAAAGDAVVGVAISADDNIVATYPIAALTSPDDDDDNGDELAKKFIEFVFGPEGQAVLARFGFGRA
jgi:molybdate transport system substrate-binding protein